jgi:alkylated DNA repair dioxygenase AlkB
MSQLPTLAPCPQPGAESITSHQHALDLLLFRSYLLKRDASALFADIVQSTQWHRVCYQSERHDNACETPCWTNFYGGFERCQPHQPVPPCMQPILERVSRDLNVPFNAVLLRLYFDGNDQITWHTDGRTFLGPEPVIASLSLGAAADFEMRHMTNVWPCAGTPLGGISPDVPQRSFKLSDGDMLVMKGRTQQQWHHRVPKSKCRGPRININFRYILHDDESAKRGVAAFYKYMVTGDHPLSPCGRITAPSFTYQQIVAKKAPLISMFGNSIRSGSSPSNDNNHITCRSDHTSTAPTPPPIASDPPPIASTPPPPASTPPTSTSVRPPLPHAFKNFFTKATSPVSPTLLLPPSPPSSMVATAKSAAADAVLSAADSDDNDVVCLDSPPSPVHSMKACPM